jgi:hypothetical protein
LTILSRAVCDISCERSNQIACEANSGRGQPVSLRSRQELALRADGRRQIIDLLLPGDFFGFTAGDKYDYTAEAVTGSTRVATMRPPGVPAA